MGSQKKILTDMTDLLFVENLGFTVSPISLHLLGPTVREGWRHQGYARFPGLLLVSLEGCCSLYSPVASSCYFG
ncbi:hypothetical protein CH063_15434 [Colletotrichum higginsianum]|nr:hypothetical protein CH063_15434 [Colletotrichum higginsianum]